MKLHEEQHKPGTYCDQCGARLLGEGAWGHDSDCPRKTQPIEMPRTGRELG